MDYRRNFLNGSKKGASTHRVALYCLWLQLYVFWLRVSEAYNQHTEINYIEMKLPAMKPGRNVKISTRPKHI